MHNDRSSYSFDETAVQFYRDEAAAWIETRLAGSNIKPAMVMYIRRAMNFLLAPCAMYRHA
jgi:hypothetical protein